MTIYAIGDIHGQRAELDRALSLVEADGGRDAPIVFLGDYTDRGPDSRGVIDRLIEGRDAGRPWRFVLGNHDRMFLNFVHEGEENDAHVGSRLSWMNERLGGRATLASYGLTGQPSFLRSEDGWEKLAGVLRTAAPPLSAQEVIGEARRLVPRAHLQFLSDAEAWVETEDLIFVHAGLRPGVALERQLTDDLLWIREGWLEDRRDHGRLVVHGHTALERPQHHGNRVNVDGGAGYGRALVPVVFEGREAYCLGDGGREALPPPKRRWF